MPLPTESPENGLTIRHSQEKPVIAIYAEPLLSPSMTFVRAQASALVRFRPVYVSPQRAVPSLEIPPEQTVVLCDNPGAPWAWNRLKQVPFKVFGYAPLFFRKVRACNPVLLHAHFGPAGLTALPLARQLKLPVVVTFHGYDATLTDKELAGSHYRIRAYVRNRHVLQREANLFLAVSQFVRNEMLARGFPDERIVVHYTGVDVEFFRPQPQVRREPVVLFTGRLVEKKGCVHLIRAMAEVQTAMPTVKLVMIGDGELRNDLEQMARATLRDCSFLGMQSADTVREWMSRATVFCGPSIRGKSGDAEGFGMVFAEAQSMELPVASFACGGITEAVAHGDTGLLAAEGDWQTLAHNLLLLLRNENLRKRMGAAGRQRILKLFDLSTQTRMLENLYTRVLTGAATSGTSETRFKAANVL
jgi:colanic acid/amylovoran biosynthesis glycosyltransferase